MNSERRIAKHFWTHAFKNRAIYLLLAFIGFLLVYAGFSGWGNFKRQNEIREEFQHEARQDWLRNPNKHPHRMAHYGHFAFRPRAPLSVFDFGMESFFGNTIFLEAHKQNPANFSEAGFSTGMLRFGEISMAMVLQILLPLLIFFVGFGSVAAERENGTLKILLCQGVSWKQLLVGKSLGMIGVTMAVFLPVMAATLIAWLGLQQMQVSVDEGLRLLFVFLGYLVYTVIFSIIAVLVSSASKTSKSALITLIGLWLMLTIVLPRASQALGSFIYKAPLKVTFNAGIEKDILKEGDSHNPDDPHYKGIRDSLLAAYQVDSVQKLPFNYNGFVMAEGEKISAGIYSQHLQKLMTIYEKQNSFSKAMAFVNPFMAIRNLSMALSGTDYTSYVDFQDQAEKYRYAMAQKMNELQIRLISNKKQRPLENPYTVDQKYWAEVPEFEYRSATVSSVLRSKIISLTAFGFWIAVLAYLIQLLSGRLLKAI